MATALMLTALNISSMDIRTVMALFLVIAPYSPMAKIIAATMRKFSRLKWFLTFRWYSCVVVVLSQSCARNKSSVHGLMLGRL